MVLSDIGYGALLLTLAAALWATIASVLGGWQRRPDLLASARNALLVTAGLSTLSAVLLLVLLFTRDFEVKYVYEHVSTYLKPAYVLAAFWAGLEGSQLLWLWMLTFFTAALVWRPPTWDRELQALCDGIPGRDAGLFRPAADLVHQPLRTAANRAG